MSTLREHIKVLQDIQKQDRCDATNQAFSLQANLTLIVHLSEVAALLDAVAKPAECAARLIAGAWQCEHCGHFDTSEPDCEHRRAPSQPTVPAVDDARDVTDAMVDAYLKANDEYWRLTDDLQKRDPGKWRNGTPKEATRESLKAALAAPAPKEPQE
jgi:hypothetical protein